MVYQTRRREAAGYRLRTLALSLSLAALVTGCTDPETQNKLAQDSTVAQAGVNDAIHNAQPVKHYNPLIVSDKVWTGNTATRMQRGIPLPEKFEGAHGVTLVSSEPMTLDEISDAISQRTGIPFHLSDGARRHAGPAASLTSGSSALGMLGAASSSSTESGGDGMQIAYEGPLSGLMERVAGHFGINWRYDGSTVTISRYEIRVFTVEALPGTQQVQEGMQDDTSSSSSSSSSGGSGTQSAASSNSITQNSKFSLDIKYWEELDKVLTSMIGGVGSVVVSPSLGTVTVQTTPELMRVVADYLAQENQRISRQIAVNVEIYSVTLSNGLDFDVAFNTALRRIGLFLGNVATAGAPTSVSGFTGGGSLSLAILDPHGDAYGNEANGLFTALSGIGNTSEVARFPLVTLNNRPVSRRIGQDINYVAEATTNTTGAGTSSTFAGTSLTPGTVHQGFSVQLTPRLLDDGRILLQYSLSIIDVLSIDSFNSVCGASSSSSTSSACSSSSSAAGSSTIELPTTSNRIFVQQSVLKSGSTLIIGGAEEDNASMNSQGVGDPYMYALGGGLSTNHTHTMLFFALTPQVLDVPHTESD